MVITTYTKHTWVEKTGTGGDKTTWLNNLETQYDDVVSYYTQTYHDDEYYLEATMGATFFAPTYDGTGSGFVAETLDGYTAAQLLTMQVPPNTVAIWYSTAVSIPSGWHLCDGRNAATPDLRGKFARACGGAIALGATGGSATVHSQASVVTIANYTLTTSDIPSHTHGSCPDRGTTVTAGNMVGGGGSGAGAETTYTPTSGSAGSSGSHGHTPSTMTTTGGTTNNNMPQYKAYCYIIKE